MNESANTAASSGSSLCCVGTYSLILMMVIGCGSKQDRYRTVFNITVTPEQRDALSPALNRLIVDMERGTVAGSLASDYSTAIAEGSQVAEADGVTAYWFEVVPRSEPNGTGVVILRVDNRSGLITSATAEKMITCW